MLEPLPKRLVRDAVKEWAVTERDLPPGWIVFPEKRSERNNITGRVCKVMKGDYMILKIFVQDDRNVVVLKDRRGDPVIKSLSRSLS